MSKCKLSVCSESGTVLAGTDWSPQTILVFGKSYQPGDSICLETDAPGCYWEIRLDDSMLPAIVFLRGTSLRFQIPFGEQKASYSPKSFSGGLHVIQAKAAQGREIHARRNLALNPYDTSYAKECFPHAQANIETRGEAVFAARNTIDGIHANASHGEYPYQSWGINRDPNAELKIDLGAVCLVDELRLTLRADFPHDNYWVRAAVNFSDGSNETVSLVKSALPQVFTFSEKRVQWVTLSKLIPSAEPSPFPALTQIELWGCVAQ